MAASSHLQHRNFGVSLSRVLFLRLMVILELILLQGSVLAQGTANKTISNSTTAKTGVVFTEREIFDMLLQDYDVHLRPTKTFDGIVGPATCMVNLLLRSIMKVDDMKMEYSVQLTFRQEWRDDRLAYDDGGHHKYLVLPDPDKIWKPDIFFQNERQGHLHNLLTPNNFVRIYPNGGVMMSTRMTLTLACPMDLHFFPMDRQICEIRIASYGYTAEDVELFWKAMPSPVQVANVSMAHFHLINVTTGYCTSMTATGPYSCLKVQLYLEREFTFYLLRLYIPMGLMVCLSWIAFWLNPEAIPARMVLSIPPLIATAMLMASASPELPVVSYTKAMDIWIVTCFVFLFGGVLEFALVNHFHQVEEQKKKKQQDADKDGEDANGNAPEDEETDLDDEARHNRYTRPYVKEPKQRKLCFGRLRIPPNRSGKIDFFARLLFPGVFLIFNLAYWFSYLGNQMKWPE